MPRVVKCGLIQATHACKTDESLDTIREANVAKHVPLIEKAASEGVDTFITGEGPHHSFIAAEELGINVLYGGHYATETFGVKALAEHLSKRFKVPWEFIDHPTGL